MIPSSVTVPSSRQTPPASLTPVSAPWEVSSPGQLTRVRKNETELKILQPLLLYHLCHFKLHLCPP